MVLQWTICLFWIEPWPEWRWSLSPDIEKKNRNVFFYCFPYLCFLSVCVSVFCFELFAARSVASTHCHSLSRPVVPKPFHHWHTHTPIKPQIRAVTLSRSVNLYRKSNNRYTEVYFLLQLPLETAPCSLRGASTSVWEPLLWTSWGLLLLLL